MISTTARKLDRELQDEHSFEVSLLYIYEEHKNGWSYANT